MFKSTLIFLSLFPFLAFAQSQNRIIPSDPDSAFKDGRLNPNDPYFQLGPLEVTEIHEEQSPALSISRSSSRGSVGLGTCGAGSVKKLSAPSKAVTSLTRKNSIPNSLAAVPSGMKPSGIESLDAFDFALDKVINIGKKIWTIVEAGAPVIDISTDVATALPQSNNGQPVCWTQFEKWQAPQSRVFGVVAKNYLGMEVVRLKYRVLFIAGGQIDGKGHYIGYATVQPSEIKVAWAYNLKVEVKAPVVFNVGTAQDPVAGMNLEIIYTVKAGLPTLMESKVYYITGLGQFEELE